MEYLFYLELFPIECFKRINEPNRYPLLGFENKNKLRFNHIVRNDESKRFENI